MSYNIQWIDVIKKEARGIIDEDLEGQRVECKNVTGTKRDN